MAGASDPLEDMLFSEVDEKAVSDLVGSLESQLAVQSNQVAPHTEMRGGGVASPANHHLGRMLPAQVGTILQEQQQQQQQQQQQGQHKAGLNQESGSKALTSGKTVIPSSLSSIPSFEGSSITSGSGVNANSSGLQSHGSASISTTLTASGLVTLPPPLVSINPGSRGTVLGTSTAVDPLKNHAASAARSAPAAIQSLNGSGGVVVNSSASTGTHFTSGSAANVPLLNSVGTSVSSAGNSNLTVASGVCTTTFSAAPTSFSPSQHALHLDGTGTPTIALQRPPVHITNVAQNGNGSPVAAHLQQGSRAGTPSAPVTQLGNHKSTDGANTKADSPTQGKIVAPSQPCVVNNLISTTTSTAVSSTPTTLAQTSTNSVPAAAASPAPLTTMTKSAVNIVAPPSATSVGVVKSVAPATVGVSPTQPQQVRPGPGPAPQRIVTPQLIVRPPQQTTIQLPPGFTIPQGMILVRTDTGQLVMVPQQALAQAQAHAQAQAQAQAQAHAQAQVQVQSQVHNSISPRPAAPTSGPAFRMASTQSTVTTPAIRPGLTVQTKSVQLSAASSCATSNPALQTSCSAVSVPKPTQTSVAVSASVTAPQPPVTVITGCQNPTQGQPQPAVQSAISSQVAPSTGVTSSPAPGVSVISQEMQENVKKCKNFLATLIKLASHNSPSPETSRNVKALVQDLLDAKIEPEEFTNRLQSELKSSPQPYLVPFLKKSLPALRQSLLNSQQSLMQTQQPQQVKPVQVPQPASQTTSGTVSAVYAGQTVRIGHPNSVTTTLPNIVQHSQVTVHSQGSQLAIKRQPTLQTTPVRMPMVITQPLRPQGTVGKTPTIQPSKSPGGLTAQVSTNQKNKLNDPGGGSFRDDDDINDVAFMAGVNLNEENARILATNSDLVGTQIRSCKDETFLPSGLLHKRILETAKRYGVTEVPAEAVNFISHATQERLRTVLEKVTVIAQHRIETYKDDEWYEQATDVRSQLKFFEQLERIEKQRKDEQEREILLKAAKSRSRQEDPEQARLKQKAKEQ
ncbi:transcription initiation factor TFIID subunit 4-like isoform X2 [Polypterus senegalus]|uniref:transcription initiation factor TFIID subunit 4-like isoform X2 n=1 Tax=Polypterus senegalus TaxID=55291 RepID=UPI001965C01E|nr:transcription initiation factor TFIID subunit 4-like isoform X2 [Polypterus senegalus]